MTTLKSLRTTGTFALVVSSSLLAQTLPPPAPDPDEIVEMSPFVIITNTDVGYVAENTLAGSRLNTKLRDTPGSVSVFTLEFLQDIGANDLKQLVEYSVNSEVDTEARNSGNGQNAFINSQNLNGKILTRGISASQGLDYFVAIAPGDGYRVGRYEDSRGPNGILFGVGAGGGMFNQSSKTAVTSHDSAQLRYTMGRWDRSRVEFDANKVLRKDRLAVSLAAVDQENGGWRNFDFQDKERVFASVTYRPVPRLTLTAMGEKGRDIGAVIRTLMESEEVLAWYDNRNAYGVDAVTFVPNNVVPTAAQTALGVTGRNAARTGTNHRAVFIENDGTLFDAVGTYLTGTYNNAAVRAPDGTPGVTGSYLRLNDPGFYPYSSNAAGPGMFRDQTLQNYTLTADYQLARHLFINLSHNYQETQAWVYLMTGASPTLYGDANRTLGVGGPTNPYAGRLYFDGEWRRDIHYHDARETRLSLSYTLLPRWKWLGTHRLAGLVSHTEEYDERANSWLVLGGSPFNAVITNANNRIFVRNYLREGDTSTYRVGDWRSLPTTINFAGGNYPLVFANVNEGDGTNGGATQTTNSRLGVVQSHLWRDRLVTTLGYREDRVRIVQFGYRREPLVGDVVDPDPAKRTTNFFIGKTYSGGAVLHLTSWASLLANRSSCVGVPSFNRTVFPDGRLADPPESEGSDYGLGFDLLGGRLNAKLVRFTSNERGATGAYGAPGSFNDRNRRIMDALAGVLVGSGRPLSADEWATLYKTYTPPISGSLADFESEGYEVRLTANLKSNWRLVLNYSYTDSGRSNLYTDAIPWYGLKDAAPHQVTQGVAQNAAGLFVVDPNAYAPGGAVAKWLQLGGRSPDANLSTLTTSANVTIAREIYNLVDEVNIDKADQEKRLNLRPHKISIFTAYDFKTGRLKGFSMGGGWRWRSANVIGENSRGQEIIGRELINTDLMLRYMRKFERLPGRVSFQINVNNVFDRTGIIPQRLSNTVTAPDGFLVPGGRGVAYSRYDLVEPRDIRFTTTYSY